MLLQALGLNAPLINWMLEVKNSNNVTDIHGTRLKNPLYCGSFGFFCIVAYELNEDSQ